MQSGNARLHLDGSSGGAAPARAAYATGPHLALVPSALAPLAPAPGAVTQPLEHLAVGSGPLPVIPPQLDGYRVLELLATGGMGGVYLAEDIETGARVALKILDPSWAAQDAIVARMLAEREVTRRVSHRGLVRILDGARTPTGHVYLAMELLDGEDLGDLLDRGHLELGAVVAIGAQIADAVAALHDARIVHCDLKPDNVMVEYHHGLAGWPRVKVLDFGVARLGAPATTDEIAGTPRYMAPEQWRGHAEPRSDVYGLGCLLYEMITGGTPFDGTLTEVMVAHCDALPAPVAARRWIPEVVDLLVSRMLAKDPGMRPRMADVAAALTELAFQFPPGARATPMPQCAHV